MKENPVSALRAEEMQEAWNEYNAYLESIGMQAQHPDFAFSSRVKKIIRARDNNQCQNHDDCPFEDEYTEIAHYDHTRNGNYNKEKNGRVSCRPSHYLDHSMEASEGLTSGQHKWASDQIWKRMSRKEKNWIRKNYPDQAND